MPRKNAVKENADQTKKVKRNEVRIRGVGDTLFEELTNICRHTGISAGELMKPQIRIVVESHPERYRKPPLDY